MTGGVDHLADVIAAKTIRFRGTGAKITGRQNDLEIIIAQILAKISAAIEIQLQLNAVSPEGEPAGIRLVMPVVGHLDRHIQIAGVPTNLPVGLNIS